MVKPLVKTGINQSSALYRSGPFSDHPPKRAYQALGGRRPAQYVSEGTQSAQGMKYSSPDSLELQPKSTSTVTVTQTALFAALQTNTYADKVCIKC